MTTSRSVRVFLSSTFRDFAEERDLLVRKVFPELRRRARERNVEVIDIDLRWGITPEQAERGEVLPICLAEIDRARPYFFGFIGDRYGWVPEANQYDLSLLVEQPWLEEHRGGKSVTELEMLHGVLNNPAMAGRAFFYFRDTQYSQARGGAYLSEGEEHRAKLESLKGRIRESGFPVMEDYPSPEVLAARVQEDLWKVIDEAFPLESVPDPVTMERRKHEVYGAARLGLYLGGEKYFTALDAAMEEEPFKPVLITGPSGGGKSALVANWAERYATAHPDAWVIMHYLGSSADAADPVRMVYRIEREIAQVTGEHDKLEGDSNKILQHFPDWLSRASAFAEESGREWIIVLDGLDKLSSRTELRWWPAELPSRVKVVASCLDGEIQSTLKARMKPCEVVVHPLNAQDGCELIRTYLARFNKVLPEPDVERIVAHPLGGSPLFLRTVSEEMRVFGVHEHLQQRLGGYLASRSMGELFAKVFDRVEEDNRREDMEVALSVLWGALESFAEDELLAVTELAPAVWSSILNALEGSLISNGGRIAFGHDYLRKSVEDRYVADSEKQTAVIRKLSDFCAERMRSEGRKANSPYVRRHAVEHFILAEQWDEAVAALSDLEFIEARAKAGELNEMLENYGGILSVLPEMREKAEIEAARKANIRRWAKDLAQCARASTRQRSEGGPKPPRPKPPKAITFKTDEEIAEECKRIIETPTRVDTLGAFQHFVATQKSPLEAFSEQLGFVAQHAYNDAPEGPIHRAGKERLDAIRVAVITRNWSASDTYNPLHPCRMILEGHNRRITSVAVSVDGSLIVSASQDGTLRVWDSSTGNCLRILEGHTDSITSLAISTDSSCIVSASEDGTLRVWDSSSGKCLRVLNTDSTSVATSVAISADGSFVVSGYYHSLRVWDSSTGNCIRVIDGADGHNSVAISTDGSFVVSPGQDKSFRVWDSSTGKLLVVFYTDAESVAISADGFVLLSAETDGTLRVWDPYRSTAGCLEVLKGHSESVTSAAISADGALVVSADAHTLRIWDSTTGNCLRVVLGNFTCVAKSEDGSVVVSADDQTLRVWNPFTANCSRILNDYSVASTAKAISADGSFVVSTSEDQILRVWDSFTGNCLSVLNGDYGAITSAAISTDGSFVASGYHSGNLYELLGIAKNSRDSLRFWDVSTGNCVRVCSGHSESVSSLAISADGSCVVSASDDKTLRVWDSSTGNCLRVLKGHSASVTSTAISADGSFIVSASDDKTLRVWDSSTGNCLRVLKGHSASVISTAISADGSFIVSASWDETLRVWDSSTGNCLRVLKGHSASVTSAAISADGSFIVSASRDKTLRVWNPYSGHCLGRLSNSPSNLFTIHHNKIVVASAIDGNFYTIRNLPLGPFITTAFRNTTARPVCCGQPVDVPAAVTERIDHWSTHPSEDGYTDPALLMPCPHCQTPLRMNPFFVAPPPL